MAHQRRGGADGREGSTPHFNRIESPTYQCCFFHRILVLYSAGASILCLFPDAEKTYVQWRLVEGVVAHLQLRTCVETEVVG